VQFLPFALALAPAGITFAETLTTKYSKIFENIGKLYSLILK